jgi:hypothetical protein
MWRNEEQKFLPSHGHFCIVILKDNTFLQNLLWCSAKLSERSNMAQRDPAVADRAPSADTLTTYDKDHLVIYLRLLDADAEGADWTEAARVVLGIDAKQEPERARAAWESHLERAKWMTTHGYKDLLRGSSSH